MPAAKKAVRPTRPTEFVRNIPSINLPQITYVLLLVAVFLVGYLLARVQMYEQGASGIFAQNDNTQTGDPAAQAQQGQTAAPREVEVEEGHLPVKGDDDAKVTIVEFTDFECPFCGRFYSDTLPQLVKDYIDTGKAKLYIRHYPLSFHPKAVPLAHASECANDQDKFWEMHDKIFDNNATVSSATDDTIKGWAAELGLDTAEFNNCYDNKEHQAEIDEDTQAAQAAGVTGTPTFYVNGKELVGAQGIEAFKAIIDEELGE